MLFIVSLSVYWLLFLPQDVHAYLDPASGSAGVSFLIAIAVTLVYWFKSIYYRLFSRSKSKTAEYSSLSSVDKRPILFSEGNAYWATFRPIVEEFIKHKKHFRYFSIDIHDPGLAIDSEFMESNRIPKNRMGFAKLSKLQGPVMLSTTPNIGCPDYPMHKPQGVTEVAHVFHAMVDLSCYRKGSLDFYDSVLMAGSHEERSIRIVEAARGVQEKKLIVAGLPYLDDLYRQKQEYDTDHSKKTGTTVLVAPSWGPKGCFGQYGTGFIKKLDKVGYNIIIRLHPHSYIFEPAAVKKWQEETAHFKNVTWDLNTFGTQAMFEADILISDTSSIRFDFVFLYKKPVISLSISSNNLDIYEGSYMEQTWADMMSEKIGRVVDQQNINDISNIVSVTLEQFSENAIRNLRNSFLPNFGKSASVIVGYLSNQSELLTLTSEEKNIR